MSSTATVRAPRTTSSGTSTAQRIFNLSDVSSKGEALPSRYGFYAGVGFGKTSLAAFAPKPIFIKTRGETGLDTLINSGQIPPTPSLPEITSWVDLLAGIAMLKREEHPYKTLVIDTANGAERLCHEFICERDFSGEWGDKGFTGYMRGFEVSLAEWRMFLNSLDELRKEKAMTIFFLMHAKVKTFKNPSGLDFDRYMPELHEKTWTLTKGWLDCILFGNLEVSVHSSKRDASDPLKKGKAADLSPRIIYANSNNATYDAKNRLGLPDEIECGETAKEAWTNLAKAIIAGRKTETTNE